MPLPIDQVEYFFEAQFDPPYSTPDEIRELTYFDGYAHWRVLLDERKQSLHFIADKEDGGNTFPTLEIGVFCSEIFIGTIPEVGTILTLKPNSESKERLSVGITKTMDGRLSFCTSVGDMPGTTYASNSGESSTNDE